MWKLEQQEDMNDKSGFNVKSMRPQRTLFPNQFSEGHWEGVSAMAVWGSFTLWAAYFTLFSILTQKVLSWGMDSDI